MFLLYMYFYSVKAKCPATHALTSQLQKGLVLLPLDIMVTPFTDNTLVMKTSDQVKQVKMLTVHSGIK